MTHVPTTRKAPPSPWAVGLFLASSTFAVLALFLVSTGYIPG